MLAFASVGCTSMLQSVKQAPKDAERLDADMHSAMARGDWKNIYSGADDGFRSETDEVKFDAFMNAVGKKLGVPTTSKQTSWRLNTTTSGVYLYSVCDTVFSKNAKGTETFVWRKSGDQFKLLGYHLNSDELVTR